MPLNLASLNVRRLREPSKCSRLLGELDVAAAADAFRVVAVYISERRSFFRWLEAFLGDSKRIVLVDDWNAILDPKIDLTRRGTSGLDRCESSLVDFMAHFDLVDRFRVDHLVKEMWT